MHFNSLLFFSSAMFQYMASTVVGLLDSSGDFFIFLDVTDCGFMLVSMIFGFAKLVLLGANMWASSS